MLGISVKQQVIEKLTNSIHQTSKTSEEYLVPPVLGRVKGAPSYVSFLNNNLNIRKIAPDFVVVSFLGEVLKIEKDEPYKHVITERDPVSPNVFNDRTIITYFNIVFEQEVVVEEKEEEVIEEKPKTLYEQKLELFDAGRYDECYEIATNELQEYITKRNYRDVFDIFEQLLDLNDKRKKKFLNGPLIDDYVKQIYESNVDNREKMQQLRNAGVAYMDINDYEKAENTYRKALSLTDDEEKIEAILKEIYQVFIRRQYDLESYIGSFFYKKQEKLMEFQRDVLLPDNYIAHDPIEATRAFQNAMADAYSRATKILGNNTSRPDYKELLWRSITDILKKDYDIDWKSPFYLNPKNRLY